MSMPATPAQRAGELVRSLHMSNVVPTPAASRDVPDVLARILTETRRTLEQRKRRTSAEELEELALAHVRHRAEPASDTLRAALGAPGISVIAEFKRRSPSAGAIRPGTSVEEIVTAYERGGAAALSVLTEGGHFEGSLTDLERARAQSALPILRKDFVVDPYQLHEARLAGADAVLLIVAALSDADLGRLHAGAHALGLDTLVEVHDRVELERALSVGVTLLGINNRDLRDFTVDVRRTFDLAAAVPPGIMIVSESGIGHPAQLVELDAAGISAVLVGESLMRPADPETALRRLRSDRGPSGSDRVSPDLYP